MKPFIKRIFSNFGIDINYTKNRRIFSDHCVDICRMIDARDIKVVFDVGANVGTVTRKYEETFPNARIFAFEPISTTVEILSKNCAFMPRVEIHQVALGAARSRMKVYHQQKSQWNSLNTDINSAIEDGDFEIVNVESLDAFCEKNQVSNIDLLKVDTEGYELEVIKGATGLLDSKSIQFLYLESGVRTQDRRHVPLWELIESLEPRGYGLFGMYDISQYQGRVHYLNALFSRNKH